MVKDALIEIDCRSSDAGGLKFPIGKKDIGSGMARKSSVCTVILPVNRRSTMGHMPSSSAAFAHLLYHFLIKRKLLVASPRVKPNGRWCQRDPISFARKLSGASQAV